MKYLIITAALLLYNLTFSQTESSEKEINEDVWFNFMQAYQDLDASLFNQIHTEDVLRIPVDADMVLVGQEYKDQNLENFNRWNAQKLKQRIEFSFLKRIQKDSWAYEIGIYKLTRFSDSGSQSFYGKFHVTLKRVSGVWKIYIDSDSSEEGTLTEEDFLKGSLLKH